MYIELYSKLAIKPEYNGPSVTIRQSVCGLAELFPYILNWLGSSLFYTELVHFDI